MDGKIIVYLLVIASMFGLFYGIDHTLAVDELQSSINGLKQELKGMEDSSLTQQTHLEQRKELLALLTAAEVLETEMETLRTNVTATKASQADVEKAYVQAVLRVRADSIGLKLPDLVLSGNRVLRLAKIQKIEKEAVTFGHAEGVLRVKAEELPADLQAKLGYVLEMPVQIPST